MAMIMTLTGTALAATGKLQIGTGGVVVLDQVKIAPSEEYTADGKSIPAVVTYTDATGKTFDYLPVHMISDFLNIPVVWSEKRNSVVLGPTAEGADYNVYTPDNPMPPNPTTPVKGAVVGPFTEISPKTVDTSKKPVIIAEENTKVQTVTGFSSGGYFNPELGKYIILKVKNNGTAPVTCLAGRSLSVGGNERFTSVDIEPGRTLTRAFSIADGTDEIHGTFLCGVRSIDTREANITVSLMQYK